MDEEEKVDLTLFNEIVAIKNCGSKSNNSSQTNCLRRAFTKNENLKSFDFSSLCENVRGYCDF
jgi:hypothetical protein